MPTSDQDSRQKGTRQRSLLSLAPKPGHGAGSAASARPAPEQPRDDDIPPFVRHQMARSRREAAHNPPPDDVRPPVSPRPRAEENRPEYFPDQAATEPDVAGETSGLAALISPVTWLRERFLRGLAKTDDAVPEAFEQPELSAGHFPAEPDPAIAEPAYHSEPAEAADPAHGERRVAADDRYWRPLIDPSKVLAGVVHSKTLIASMTVVGGLLGVYMALSTPKKYQSVAEVIVDPRDLKLVDRDLTDNGLSTEASLAVVENQARIISSGIVLDKVVDQLDLANDPEFNGEGGHGGLGSILAKVRSLLAHRINGDGVDVKRSLAVSNLAESLDVERTGKTFIVDITATTHDPEKSALIVNTVIKVFVAVSGQMEQTTAGRATDELNSRLNELRSSVETAERKAETFRSDHDLIDAQGKLISDDQLLKLNDQLSAAKAHVADLSSRASSIGTLNVNLVLNGALPEQIASPLMTELRSQYATLKQDRDRLAVKLGPLHPELQAIDAQLAGARAQIETELHRIAASLQIELKRSVQLEQDLSAQLAGLKVKQGGISSDLVSLRELERDPAAKRSVYEAFLLRSKETGEQKDISSANISVISPAYPALTAEGPSRVITAVLGAFLGFLFGVALGAARGTLASLRASSTGNTRLPRPIRIVEQPDRQEPAPAADAEPVAPRPASRPVLRDEPKPVSALRDGPVASSVQDGDELMARLSKRLDALMAQVDDRDAQVRQNSQPQRPDAEPQALKPLSSYVGGTEPASLRVAVPHLVYPQPAPHPLRRSTDFRAPEEPRLRSLGAAAAEPGEQRDLLDDLEISPIDEVRASLREFRDATRDPAEARNRRRY